MGIANTFFKQPLKAVALSTAALLATGTVDNPVVKPQEIQAQSYSPRAPGFGATRVNGLAAAEIFRQQTITPGGSFNRNGIGGFNYTPNFNPIPRPSYFNNNSLPNYNSFNNFQLTPYYNPYRNNPYGSNSLNLNFNTSPKSYRSNSKNNYYQNSDSSCSPYRAQAESLAQNIQPQMSEADKVKLINQQIKKALTSKDGSFKYVLNRLVINKDTRELYVSDYHMIIPINKNFKFRSSHEWLSEITGTSINNYKKVSKTQNGKERIYYLVRATSE